MIAVVGAGPAGMAAALRARECGAEVVVVDDNPAPGGQIWRGVAGQKEVARFRGSGIRVLSGVRVVAGDPVRRELRLDGEGAPGPIRYDKLVIATGARELFLPFPGWTLPGVFGAGGLQAMAKSGMPVKGKSVVIAGTGPLLVAVAASLRERGARVKLVAEQAAAAKVAGFAAAVGRFPAKAARGLGLAWKVAGIPFAAGCWVEAAHGDGRLSRVTLRRGSEVWEEDCDYAGVGYGLRANTELAELMGGPSEDVFVAGTGDVDLSWVEGEIAGFSAAGRLDRAKALEGRRAEARRFAAELDRAFALRDELRGLAVDDTVVCRCEDVVCGRLRGFPSFRAAKLHTRCGMGACQGRVCGPAAGFLLGWGDTGVRPPVFPAEVAALLKTTPDPDGSFPCPTSLPPA